MKQGFFFFFIVILTWNVLSTWRSYKLSLAAGGEMGWGGCGGLFGLNCSLDKCTRWPTVGNFASNLETFPPIFIFFPPLITKKLVTLLCLFSAACLCWPWQQQSRVSATLFQKSKTCPPFTTWNMAVVNGDSILSLGYTHTCSLGPLFAFQPANINWGLGQSPWLNLWTPQEGEVLWQTQIKVGWLQFG